MGGIASPFLGCPLMKGEADPQNTTYFYLWTKCFNKPLNIHPVLWFTSKPGTLLNLFYGTSIEKGNTDNLVYSINYMHENAKRAKRCNMTKDTDYWVTFWVLTCGAQCNEGLCVLPDLLQFLCRKPQQCQEIRKKVSRCHCFYVPFKLVQDQQFHWLDKGRSFQNKRMKLSLFITVLHLRLFPVYKHVNVVATLDYLYRFFPFIFT